ncbi:hypothetical protein PHYBOEH_011467 [Phytophthora boehmeriae]|uniref:Uncharacterized protein n=1 Tax=Phytophthora boehmeriae TaxID=109152 RepID=A0A8T1WVS9_9STRA|nr:hypothetical protein PHYBOEH_011467 [Phytophthora boehmeriae]
MAAEPRDSMTTPREVSVVGRFQSELHERVAETLRSVCGTFQQELELAAQPPEPVAPSALDYDTYNDCCQRLIAYISANMVTSPHFVQMMDRIILACHSDTSESVLGSLVTKDVWLHPRGKQQATADNQTDIRTLRVEEDINIKTERTELVVNAEQNADTTSEPRTKLSVTAREGVSSAVVTPVPTRSSRKRLQTKTARTSLASAKRQKRDVPQNVIEMLSSEGEKEKSDRYEGASLLFGSDTEPEEEITAEYDDEYMYEGNNCGSGDDEDDDEDWIDNESEDEDHDEDDEREDREITCEPARDTIGKMCYPECRSPQQTKAFREKLRKALQFVDALFCKPPPGKICSRNCQKLRAQRCLNFGPCQHEMCQLWHEVDAHVACCRNMHCECKIRVVLRETTHQIAHQHVRIRKVNAELSQRNKEFLTDKSSPLPRNPLLKQQVKLLEQELRSEEDQLEFYHFIKRVNAECAKEVDIDIANDFADFTTHYVPRDPATASTASAQDELLYYEDSIGKLCYAAQRTQEQTEFFKKQLRKSIQFVDAILCKPPPGKVCVRGCKTISAQRCKLDVPCDNKMCRIWHDAEAHTDNCLNPQCEFKLRIVLRETMHTIEDKRLVIQKERSKLVRKKAALAAIKDVERNDQEPNGDAPRSKNPRQRDQFLKFALLQDEVEQLEENLKEEEENLQFFIDKKKDLWASLHTIGIDENDDSIDCFPEFSTHYASKKRFPNA